MSAATRPLPRPRHRRAFTLLEMLLAISLSSLVVLLTMSMVMMLYRSEKRLGDIARDNEDLAVAQEILRRAMQSLVAAPPLTDEQMAQLFPEEVAAEADAADASRAEGLDDAAASAAAGLDPSSELIYAEVDARPRFDLHFVPGDSGPLPRLEIVTFTSPTPAPTLNVEDDPLGALAILLQDSSAVRGAFEVVEHQGSYALQWAPIEPWGYPTILVKDIEYIEWAALERLSRGGQWQPVFSSYLGIQYPEAVRLIIWTATGAEIDWIFKVEVIPGEQL